MLARTGRELDRGSECKKLGPRPGAYIVNQISVRSRSANAASPRGEQPPACTPFSRLRFRSDLVVAQSPHEHFLVYGLPGVVEYW